MRVLHILNELRPSGAEVSLKVAAPYWQKAGIDLHIVSTGNIPGAYADTLAEAGYKIHHLPFRKTPAFFARLRRLVRTEHFDIVHINTERANFPYALIARSCGVPIIVRTIRSVFLFEGKLRISRAWMRALERRIGVTQVSNSPSVQENEKIRFGNPTVLIPTWYDDQYFCPPSREEKLNARKKLPLAQLEKAIISIGNCNRIKNHHTLIQALSLLNKEGIDFVYLHVGEEEPGHDEQAVAQNLGLISRVRFLGRQVDVRPYLWASDLFVMPSIYEGLGLAAIEALACGLPAVLTEVLGLRDLKTTIPEIVYTSGSKELLANAIRSALEHPPKPSIGSLQRLREHYGKYRGVRAYAALYGVNIDDAIVSSAPQDLSDKP
jgi:glycosyltransferase involved in cell wall biosynthesis